MKKLIVLSALALAMTATVEVKAQKVKLENGKLSALGSVKKVNIVYDYSDMSVGKYDKESEYISKKKSDYNDTEAGRGDSWEKAWIADRENRFEPQFEELFSKYSELDAGDHPDAKYTLIFKTTRTEPGFNIHITRKNAEIDGELYLVETANQDKKLAKVSVRKSPGRTFGGYDYDSGTRIQEAYAAAGKAVGKLVKKETK